MKTENIELKEMEGKYLRVIRENEEETRILKERCKALEKYSDDILKVRDDTSYGSKSARGQPHSNGKERGEFYPDTHQPVTFYKGQSGYKSQSGVEDGRL